MTPKDLSCPTLHALNPRLYSNTTSEQYKGKKHLKLGQTHIIRHPNQVRDLTQFLQFFQSLGLAISISGQTLESKGSSTQLLFKI